MTNTASASESSYEQVAYPNWTHQETHPRQLEATARLFGMNPAAVTGCKVLELGCAAGWNLIPMAQSLPGSTFVGIDYSPSQIAEARTLATEAAARYRGHRHRLRAHGAWAWRG